ncbi:MAG: UPF0755 protein [Flavobacteriales bacterium]|jgi:UPF0755 protein
MTFFKENRKTFGEAKNPLVMIGRISLLLGIILVCIVGFKMYQYINSNNITLEEGQEYVLTIPTGYTYDEVYVMLEEKEILKNTFGFQIVAVLKKYPDLVRSGRYTIEAGMSNSELINMLRSGYQNIMKITFNNVGFVEEMVGMVAKKIEPDSLALLQAIRNAELNRDYGFNERNVAALFIPNTYELYWNTTAEAFVYRMSMEFEAFWTEERRRKAADLNLSLTEVTTLASIVQKETLRRDEQPVVAGLYLNRLKKNWKLQSDPTVIYALKEKYNNRDTVIRRVLYSDLKIVSDYNTYLNKGLPPGPICLPEIQAIDAVLNHEEHNYMYMCAKEDFSGCHNFAVNGTQHLINRRKYTRALNRRKINR